MLERQWGVDGRDLRLVLESIQVPPALVLAQTFADARIEVYGDGLMSYGPTRIGLPATVGARIERLLHLDLVPGVRPLLLSEFGIRTELIDGAAFRKVITALGPPPESLVGGDGAVAVLVGQYLSSAGLITAAEEQDLHAEMVRVAVRAGFTELIFKPHPSAPDSAGPVAEVAAALGARLRIVDQPALVETWLDSPAVGLVVGCFSTALFTAGALYGRPTAQVGTDLVLRRLSPYENSNRIPAVLADAGIPDLAGATGELVQAVGYCMQPERYPDHRTAAERLHRERPDLAARYVSRRRRNELALPGAAPPRGPIKQVLRQVVGPQRYRNWATAWRRVAG